MGRHSWEHDDPQKGYSTCKRCKIVVKTYKIKKGEKGGIQRCDPKNAIKAPKKKSLCEKYPERHLDAMIAGSRVCWNCGELYSYAELKAGEAMMEEILQRDITPDQLKQELKDQLTTHQMLQQLLV